MDMSIYLLLGLLIGSMLLFRMKSVFGLFLLCAYWLVVLLWSSNFIEPFYFSQIPWVSMFGINIEYKIDGLSKLFALLISGVGILVFIYAWLYTQKTVNKRPKLLSLLQFFAVSMLGVVLADDMLMLFMCWELTSITSYLLIQFDVSDSSANQAAFNSLFVSVMGSLTLLIGFIMLSDLSGSWAISDILTMQTQGIPSSKLLMIFSLVMGGVITKSAQFPFYFWLTGAMKAPTPVSAYLHSATMVNAGIYLLARFHPLFSQTSMWYPLLSFFGLLTMVISSVLSVLQKDLKAVLAYTTVFALGTMVYLLGGKTVLPIEAFTIFLLFHGVYKAGAFMLVGIIDQEYETRQLENLSGILRSRPLLAICTVIIFGAMAGLPPFFGFTMKEIIFEAKLASPTISFLLVGVSILSSMLIAAASLRCLWYFFKKSVATPILQKHNLRHNIYCPLALAALVVLFSIPLHYTETLVRPTLLAILPQQKISFAGTNELASFLLSLLTASGGIFLLYLYSLKQIVVPEWMKSYSLRHIFEVSLSGFLRFGAWLTDITQGQSLIVQFRIMLLSIVALVSSIGIVGLDSSLTGLLSYVSFPNFVVAVLLIIASLSLLVSRKFLYNLISLSLVGFASSLFFIVNGAIDVAITQLLVEVLTIIILLLALHNIGIKKYLSNRHSQYFNAFIGLIYGLFTLNLLSKVNAMTPSKDLQMFYKSNSEVIAQGKNVVNVILVDFRSLDTFGEALVIVATTIGIALLLKKYAPSNRKSHDNLT